MLTVLSTKYKTSINCHICGFFRYMNIWIDCISQVGLSTTADQLQHLVCPLGLWLTHAELKERQKIFVFINCNPYSWKIHRHMAHFMLVWQGLYVHYSDRFLVQLQHLFHKCCTCFTKVKFCITLGRRYIAINAYDIGYKESRSLQIIFHLKLFIFLYS